MKFFQQSNPVRLHLRHKIWRTYDININIKISPIKMVQSIHKQYYQYIAMWHALLKNLKICLKCVILVMTLHIHVYHHNKVMTYRYIFSLSKSTFSLKFIILQNYFAFITFENLFQNIYLHTTNRFSLMHISNSTL